MLAASTKSCGKAACGDAAFALLFLLLLAAAGIVRAGNTPVVFQSTETPPYWSEYLPENGFAGAMLKLLSADAGVEYSLEFVPVKRFRNSIATYMVGDPELLINQKHRAILPIGLFRSAFFYYKPHHETIEFRNLRGLQGYTLGVLRGTLEDKDYFDKNGIKVEESDSVESLLKKLKRGRIDFCILVNGTGTYWIKQIFPEEQDNFVKVVIPGSYRPIAIMIDVDVPEGKDIAARYRFVLDKTLRSRKYHDILENFYGKNNIPGERFDELKRFQQYYASTWDN
ncbi:MAG: ABC transporter substrate-binding protein [Methylococcales bacterium]|nr:ABC transporter substrate-binding protein [Methylococcales bacterium]